MDLKKIKRIHLIGVGGIGMSAIAKLFKAWGAEVSGSDMSDSEIIENLKNRGIKIFKQHKAKNISSDIELVIYSLAISEDNPERKEARRLKIKELSYPQILGEISKDKKTIAISGTNGKTTVTAMAGLILEEAGLDPLVIVGSKVKDFDENLKLGQGEYFVVEACEYRAAMLELKAENIILTNIEEDHLDYYKDIKHIIKTFQKYINKLSNGNLLILNADDPNCQKLKKPDCKAITYGIKNKADLAADKIKQGAGYQNFYLKYKGKDLGKFTLKIPGEFNIYNALAAAACGLSLNIDKKIIYKVLEKYKGSWRRFEKVGELNGSIIISDYAHHPTAVAATIRAAKNFYPGKRIVAVFQPHQHNRTKKLFNDFVKSFDDADLVILSEIFDVAGREELEDQDISSKKLAEEVRKRGIDVLYGEDLDNTEKIILDNISNNDVVLIMGAGDIYLVANDLVKNNSK